MAKSTKGSRNTNIIECPNPRCKGSLELTFQGERYKHYNCRDCGVDCVIPLEKSK